MIKSVEISGEVLRMIAAPADSGCHWTPSAEHPYNAAACYDATDSGLPCRHVLAQALEVARGNVDALDAAIARHFLNREGEPIADALAELCAERDRLKAADADWRTDVQRIKAAVERLEGALKTAELQRETYQHAAEELNNDGQHLFNEVLGLQGDVETLEAALREAITHLEHHTGPSAVSGRLLTALAQPAPAPAPAPKAPPTHPIAYVENRYGPAPAPKCGTCAGHRKRFLSCLVGRCQHTSVECPVCPDCDGGAK